MLKWFRSGPSPYQTALAMIGAKPGQRVLMAGAGEPGLAAELALVTGLNGSTLVIDPGGDADGRIEKAARDAGALIEFETGPLVDPGREADVQDIAVLPRFGELAAEQRADLVAEALRLLRPGGRVVLIDGRVRPGRFAAMRSASPSAPAEEVVALLAGAGGRAARVLGTADGVKYFEARRAFQPAPP